MIFTNAFGTHHRNHCNLCLWSKHVDNTPGDRGSNCGGRMKPIKTVLKDLEENPFTDRISGEIMVVHVCLVCGKVQANRIAGDDNAELIYELPTQEDKEIIRNILWGFEDARYKF
jgi:hypothetical protein